MENGRRGERPQRPSLSGVNLFRARLDCGVTAGFGVNFALRVAFAARISNTAIELFLASKAFPWEKTKKIHETVPESLRSGDPPCRPAPFAFWTIRIHAIFSFAVKKLVQLNFYFGS